MKTPVIYFFGATGGIGDPMCRALVEKDCKVLLIARDEKKLSALESELGPNSKSISADANNVEQVQKAFFQGRKMLGEPDAVVISLGKWVWSSLLPIGDMGNPMNIPPRKSWELIQDNDTLEQTIARPTIVVAAVAQEEMQEKGGVIFNLSSHIVETPELAGNLGYIGPKAKAHAFVAALRHELSAIKSKLTTCNIVASLVNTAENRKNFNLSQEEWASATQPKDMATFVLDCLKGTPVPTTKHFKSTTRV